MSLNRRCAHCGSMDTQPTVDEIQCRVCGGLTRSDGTAVPKSEQYGPDWKEEDGQSSDLSPE